MLQWATSWKPEMAISATEERGFGSPYRLSSAPMVQGDDHRPPGGGLPRRGHRHWARPDPGREHPRRGMGRGHARRGRPDHRLRLPGPRPGGRSRTRQDTRAGQRATATGPRHLSWPGASRNSPSTIVMRGTSRRSPRSEAPAAKSKVTLMRSTSHATRKVTAEVEIPFRTRTKQKLSR